MNPNTKHQASPSYREVCSGTTGHVEVLHFRFDSNKINFEELVRYFFTFHDPTTLNRQGNDKGTQYASRIFYHSKQQQDIAEMIIT